MKNTLLILIFLVTLLLINGCTSESSDDNYIITYHIDEQIVKLVSFKEKSEVTLLIPSKTGYDFIGWYNKKDVKINKIYSNKDYELWAKWEKSQPEGIYLSFDDVKLCFNNLATNNYDSLYDEPFFKKLKELHEEYDIKVSLYTYNNVLDKLSDKYKDEFIEASDWLKVGFHSHKEGMSLASTNYDNAKAYWNSFVSNVIRVCGTVNSIDRYVRLEYFAGSLLALKGLTDAEYGALGFYSADDNRNSYYFNDEMVNYLYYHDELLDKDNNIHFISTDIRLDWFYNFSTNNQYREPLYDNVYDELEYRYNSDSFIASNKYIVVFTHEWLVYSGTIINTKFNSVIEVCDFAKDNLIEFKFKK